MDFEVMKVLVDPTRNEIFEMLKEHKSLTAGEIAEQFKIIRSTVSHHLNKLKTAGLVIDERDGQHMRYSLHPLALLKAGMQAPERLKTKKDLVLGEILKICERNQCELILNEDKPDEGSAMIFRNKKVLVRFEYFMQTHSFKIYYTFPHFLQGVHIRDDDPIRFQEFLNQLEQCLSARVEEKSHREQLQQTAFRICNLLKSYICVEDHFTKEDDASMNLLEDAFYKAIGNEKFSESELETLKQEVFHWVIRLGPIQPFVEDEAVTEIFCNTFKNTYYLKDGQKLYADGLFSCREELEWIYDKFNGFASSVLPGWRVYRQKAPFLSDCYLRFVREKGKLDTLLDLVGAGTLSEEMAEFIDACVKSKANLLITGPIRSGKSTLLNVLSQLVPLEDQMTFVNGFSEIKTEREDVLKFSSDCEFDYVSSSRLLDPTRRLVINHSNYLSLPFLVAINEGASGSMMDIESHSADAGLHRLAMYANRVKENVYQLPFIHKMQEEIDVVISLKRFDDGVVRIFEMGTPELTSSYGCTIEEIFSYDENDKRFIQKNCRSVRLRKKLMDAGFGEMVNR